MAQLAINKVTGQLLTASEVNQIVNESNAQDTKLSGVADGATANSTDAALRDRTTHTGTQSADTLTDGVTNKLLTAAEKTKLAGIATGATANDTDLNLKARANHTGTQSADTLTDGTTNRLFTSAEKTKLSGVATGATANSTDLVLLARANHTGTQSADTVIDGTTNKAYTATEKTKLAGVATGATAWSAAQSVGSILAGYAKATVVSAISGATTVLQAIGILEKALDAKADLVGGLVPTAQIPETDLMTKVNLDQFESIGTAPNELLSIKASVLAGGGGAAYNSKGDLLLKRTQGWLWSNDTTTRPVLNMGANLITGTSNSQSYSLSADNWGLKQPRYGVDSAATANAWAAVRTGLYQFNLKTGFDFTIKFVNAETTFVAGSKSFYGMFGGIIEPTVADEPSAYINCVGIGNDSTDTTYQVIHNDATGVATKMDTGIPCNTVNTDVIEFTMVKLPATGAFTYSVKRITHLTGVQNGATVTGTISGNVPLDTQRLAIFTGRANGASGGIVTMVQHVMLVEFPI